MRRSIEEPSGMPGGSTGTPLDGDVDPVKLPQDTQSSESQQTAPPAAGMLSAESIKSGLTPNAVSTPSSPTRIVCWLTEGLGRLPGKVKVPTVLPVESCSVTEWLTTRFSSSSYICS